MNLKEPSIRMHALVPGLVPDGDKMVKSGVKIEDGELGSPPPCLITGSGGGIVLACARVAHNTAATRLNTAMRSDFMKFPPNSKRMLSEPPASVKYEVKH